MWITKINVDLKTPNYSKHVGLGLKIDVGIAFSNWVVT
jgi:hypothetical protein